MSNQLINAVIALVEDRPKDAREMLRSPGSKISVSEVQNRLAFALRNRENAAAIAALKGIIRATLRMDPPSNGKDTIYREAYLEGVAEVERIIDNAISELQS